jgi:hypothetical protein
LADETFITDAYAALSKPQTVSAEGRQSWLEWLKRQPPARAPRPAMRPATVEDYNALFRLLSRAPERHEPQLASVDLFMLRRETLAHLKADCSRAGRSDLAQEIEQHLRARDASRVYLR